MNYSSPLRRRPWSTAIAALTILALIPVIFIAAGPGVEPDADPPRTVRAVLDTIHRDPDGFTEWCGEFHKITGATLDFLNPPHGVYSEQLKAYIASGENIDVMEVMIGDFPHLAEKGFLYPLDDLIANSESAKSVKPEFLYPYRLADGHTYAFPLNAGGGCVMYVRKDWLDILGMDVPKTFDEFIIMLRAFTYNDPDRNGKKDTFGYTMPFAVPTSEFDYYNRFFMLDARFDFFMKNGLWVDGFSEPEMAKALERFQGARYLNRPGPCFAIYAKSENPEFAFKTWIETSVDRGQGQTLFTYGVEGVHYEITDSGMKFLPLRSNPRSFFEKAYIDPTLMVNDYPPRIPLDPLTTLSREIHILDSIPVPIVPYTEIYARNASSIGRLKFEIFRKIVKDELSIEAGLAAYRDQAAALHVDEIIAELNRK